MYTHKYEISGRRAHLTPALSSTHSFPSIAGRSLRELGFRALRRSGAERENGRRRLASPLRPPGPQVRSRDGAHVPRRARMRVGKRAERAPAVEGYGQIERWACAATRRGLIGIPRAAAARAFPFYTETLRFFVAHGSRPAAGACAGAPHSRRAAVAACRVSVKDEHARGATLPLRFPLWQMSATGWPESAIEASAGSHRSKS